MSNFIAEVVGQQNVKEGVVVTIRVTGVGGKTGPMMARAKARAIAASRFGRDTASFEKATDVEGQRKMEKEEIFADKSEGLFTGPLSGVKDRLQAFRKSGVFAEVKKSVKKHPDAHTTESEREKEFGPLKNVVETYEYEILVTTRYAFS